MKNEKLYLEIVNNMRDGAYFTNTERKITLWNKAAEDITGYTKEEMIGKHCQETNLRHIDESGRLICVTGCPIYHTLADGVQRKHDVFLGIKTGTAYPFRSISFLLLTEGTSLGQLKFSRPTHRRFLTTI